MRRKHQQLQSCRPYSQPKLTQSWRNTQAAHSQRFNYHQSYRWLRQSTERQWWTPSPGHWLTTHLLTSVKRLRICRPKWLHRACELEQENLQLRDQIVEMGQQRINAKQVSSRMKTLYDASIKGSCTSITGETYRSRSLHSEIPSEGTFEFHICNLWYIHCMLWMFSYIWVWLVIIYVIFRIEG